MLFRSAENRGEPDITARGAAIPLRHARGLHTLALSRLDAGLARTYPPHDAEPNRPARAVLEALKSHEGSLSDWLNFDLGPIFFHGRWIDWRAV